MGKWIVNWTLYGDSINIFSWIDITLYRAISSCINPEHKIEFWYSTSWIIALGPSWPWLCWLKSWMQWPNSTGSFEIKNHTVLSPTQAKLPEKFPMNPTKGVCNTLWNISHKVQLVAQVPGSILFILGFKTLHRKSVVMLFNIVK